MSRYRLVSVRASPLSVPLSDPFVIASARVDVTPNVLVEVEMADGTRTQTGLGEAATLHPVTRETQDSVLGAFAVLDVPSEERALSTWTRWARDAMPGPCAAAGLESAILDAIGRLEGRPVWSLLGGVSPAPIRTDVTIPIGDAGHRAKLARRWRARGFRSFKVKVGRDLDEDLRALEQIRDAVPDATYRIDANAAFTAAEALSMAREVEAMGLVVECWEQPCGRLALDAMAEVARELPAPVIADESVSNLADLEAVCRAKAADGVNLKLVKSGGLEACVEIGREAKRRGLVLMAGAMVEARPGICAAAHLVTALGGVEFPDLDTAFLLASDPFVGGYTSEQDVLSLVDGAGLGVRRREG